VCPAEHRFLVSQMKQSVLVTGFCGFGYSLERRGWRVDKHSTFTRRPQGSFAAAKKCPAAFSICQVSHSDRLPTVFVSTCEPVHVSVAKSRLLISNRTFHRPDAPQQSRPAPAWRLCFCYHLLRSFDAMVDIAHPTPEVSPPCRTIV